MLNQRNNIASDELEASQHLLEIASREHLPKHPLYNRLLKIFKLAQIPVETLNSTTIICQGQMSGLWFRPETNRCRVFIGRPKGFGNSVVNTNWDFHVSYSAELLFYKLYDNKLISPELYTKLYNACYPAVNE